MNCIVILQRECNIYTLIFYCNMQLCNLYLAIYNKKFKVTQLTTRFYTTNFSNSIDFSYGGL